MKIAKLGNLIFNSWVTLIKGGYFSIQLFQGNYLNQISGIMGMELDKDFSSNWVKIFLFWPLFF